MNGPYWGVPNWGNNLRLRVHTGLGWEKDLRLRVQTGLGGEKVSLCVCHLIS